MMRSSLKSFLPRSLYGRAALIVFFPVIVLMLVVTLTFVQRHYNGVTRQMTGNFVLVAEYIAATLDAAPDASAAAQQAAGLARAFDLSVVPNDALPEGGTRARLPFYDLSGRLAFGELQRGLPGLLAMDFGRSDVALWLHTRHGPVRLGFDIDRISARNPHQLLVLTLVVGLLVGGVSFIYLKNQMRPMARLALAAEAFGHGRAVSFRPAGATEVRAAGAAFLKMRARIERHIEQRTLMLSGVSHDLRTPLTRMRLALSMLEDEPEQRALLADVAEMEALIDRFLDFARAEAIEDVEPVDLGALVAQRVAEAARSGRDVVYVGAGSGPVLMLKPQMMARAVDNLIGNALRYGTRARVCLEGEGPGAMVSVEDDGPGIAAADFERATRPFVRLDKARGATGGAGLGLAIVADAMRSHGGRLELGRGATPGYGGLMARLVLPG